MAVNFNAVFKAQDKVSSQLKNINSSGDKLNSTFKKLAGTAAGVFTVAKVVDFSKQSVSAFADFDNSINEVFTLLPDITEEAMGDMIKDVKAFAKELGVLPDKAVPALYQALSAGVPQDNVFEFLQKSNKAAVGGVTSIETAVDGLSTVVNSYGSDIMSVDKASDLMFTTVKLGKTTFDELSSSLFNVLPTASAAGIGFEDVSAALAVMTSQGVPTSVATTQLRQAFVELTKSGSSVDKVFKKIAGKGFKEFIAEGNNTQDALKLLEKYASRTGVGINDLFGSVEAGNAVLALTGGSTETFTNALLQMESAGGATDKAFQTMERGVSRTIEKLKAKFEVFKIDVGEKLVDTFWKVSDVLMPTINDIYDKSKQFYEFVKTNWPTIAPVLMGIVGALVAYKTITTAMTIATKAQVFIEAVHKTGLLAATAAQLTMNVEDITKAIESEDDDRKDYHPQEISCNGDDIIGTGTKIVLRIA